jgi:hypothetical protein
MLRRTASSTHVRLLGAGTFALVLLVCGAASAAPAGQDALPVAVVQLKTDDALDQAEALTQALRKAVRDSQGWSLREGNFSLDFLAVQMKCSEPIDAACEARISEVIQAERYVWGVLQFTDKKQATVTGTLHFFVRGKGTSKTDLNFSANLTDPNDDALIRLARDALNKVTGGPPRGVVKVLTGGAAGQLYVDGKPLGAVGAEGGSYQLPSGPHTIVVKAPGHADATAQINVKPLVTVEVSVTLTPIEDDTPIDGRMIGGFVALGLGAVAGGIGLWAALEVNSIRNDEGVAAYANGVRSSQDYCEFAENNVVVNQPGASSPTDVADKCDKASTFEIIQIVSFPVAAVGVGVGAYLLGTSSLATGGEDESEEKETPAAWSIEPAVGPHRQSVHVRYKF